MFSSSSFLPFKNPFRVEESSRGFFEKHLWIRFLSNVLNHWSLSRPTLWGDYFVLTSLFLALRVHVSHWGDTEIDKRKVKLKGGQRMWLVLLVKHYSRLGQLIFGNFKLNVEMLKVWSECLSFSFSPSELERGERFLMLANSFRSYIWKLSSLSKVHH